MTTLPPIVIIGAGVLGLTTAAVLQEMDPKLSITIVAAEVPLEPPVTDAPRPSADYASMWAGAHVRPIHGPSAQLSDEQDLLLQTTTTMEKIARNSPESGVEEVMACEVTEFIPEDTIHLQTGDIYAGENDSFRIMEPQELPPLTMWGCEYKTWVINIHVYCRWLLSSFTKLGGTIIQKKLSTVEDAFDVLPSKDGTPLVINCSGRNFDTDSKTNIIRGQTVLVQNEYHRTVTRQNKDGSWSFLIPRPLGGGTIVGGTKQVGDWDSTIRPEDTTAVLTSAVNYWPDFVNDVDKFKVAMENVGRRPFRKGGLRIEAETLRNNRTIVHGYGAGGRGYELSWGAARRIVNIVTTLLRQV
jgi:D-amino-acid oxidase